MTRATKACEEQARNVAGAACRNAAAAIDEAYQRVEQAARAAGTQERVVEALYHMDNAVRLLDAAADSYYGEEEQK